MSNKLYQVFKTYWTRRDCLLLLAVFCLFCIFIRWGRDSLGHVQLPIAPRLSSPAVEIQGNTRELEIPQEERKARRIRSVNLSVIEEIPLPPLQRLPNLRRPSLKAMSLSQKQADQVLALPKLESLKLDVREIPEGFLSGLGPQLKQLKLPAFLLNEHAAELSRLTHLELLRIDQSELHRETLKAIATIPHLQRLVIQRDPMEAPSPPGKQRAAEGFPGELSFPEADFLPLIQHPTLREIYAEWGPELTRNRAFLSQVHAYPFYAAVGRNPAFSLAVFAVMVISMIVLIQLAAQFLNPAATVIPRYLLPHCLVAGSILAVGVLIVYSISKQNQFSGTSTFTILLAAPCLITSIVLLSSIPREYALASQFANLIRFLLIFSIFLTPNMLIIAPPWIPGTLDWYLRGHYPKASFLILCAEVGMLVLALSNAHRIGRLVSQAYPDWNGTSFFRWQNQQERTLKSASGNWQLKGVDAKLAHLTFHQGNFWKQVRLLQLGNPYRPTWTTIPLAVFGLAGLVLMGPFQSLQSLVESFIPVEIDLPQIDLFPMFILFLIEFGVIAIWIPAQFWYRRRTSLEMEFCRPVNREDFARQLFCAMAIDQGLAVIPILAIFLIWTWGTDSMEVRTSFLLSSPLILTGAICLYGISTSIFAIRRSWVLNAVAIIGFLLFIFGVGGIVGLISSRERERFFLELDAARLMAVGSAATGIALVGMMMTWWMFRKTRSREWG